MQEVEKIIITDTHFGKYNNSLNFLSSQKKLFDQLFNIIKSKKGQRFDLIHLGDLFDSRSSISMYILSEVKILLKKLYDLTIDCNDQNRIIFVAGNHDFYSPNSDEVNSLDLIVKNIIPDVIVVDREIWCDGDDAYIPWYQMNNPEELNKFFLENYPKRIFTHCDCYNFKHGLIPVNTSVYSGHIHTYKEYNNDLSFNPISKLYNLSSPYGLDFGDSNDLKKGIWILNGYDLKLIPNKESIRYRSFVNSEIFDINDLDESIERRDNFRIYISTENRSQLNYMKKINELSSKIKYINIILTSEQTIIESINVGSLDVEIVLRDMIPEHLQEEFNIINKEVHNED